MDTTRSHLRTRQFELMTTSKELEAELSRLRAAVTSAELKYRETAAELEEVEKTPFQLPSALTISPAILSTPRSTPGHRAANVPTQAFGPSSETASRPGLVPNEEHWQDDEPIASKHLGQEFGCVQLIQTPSGLAWHEIWCGECGQNTSNGGSARSQHYMKGLDGLGRHYRGKHAEVSNRNRSRDGRFGQSELKRIMGAHRLTNSEMIELCTRRAIIKPVREEFPSFALPTNPVAINDVDDEIRRQYAGISTGSADTVGSKVSDETLSTQSRLQSPSMADLLCTASAPSSSSLRKATLPNSSKRKRSSSANSDDVPSKMQTRGGAFPRKSIADCGYDDDGEDEDLYEDDI